MASDPERRTGLYTPEYGKEKQLLREALLAEITKVVPDFDRLVRRMNIGHLEKLVTTVVEPYSLSVFGLSGPLTDKREKTRYRKLTIDTSVLIGGSPELAERFKEVEVSHIEFESGMLGLLDPETRQRVVTSVAEWEEAVGMNVRYTGVVGLRPAQTKSKSGSLVG